MWREVRCGCNIIGEKIIHSNHCPPDWASCLVSSPQKALLSLQPVFFFQNTLREKPRDRQSDRQEQKKINKDRRWAPRPPSPCQRRTRSGSRSTHHGMPKMYFHLSVSILQACEIGSFNCRRLLEAACSLSLKPPIISEKVDLGHPMATAMAKTDGHSRMCGTKKRRSGSN